MKPRPVLLVSALMTLPALVAGVGLCFHTSFDPVVLGKYSVGYFGVLCGWMLLVVPSSYLLAKFMLATQTIVLSSGRRLAVRPLPKIAALVVLGLPSWLVVRLYVGSLIASRTTTFLVDVFHPYLQNVPNPDSRKLAINSSGFRGPEITRSRPEGTFRIFVFGGSSVFCGTLRVPKTHCGLLQARLTATYPDTAIEVLNVGADWHCSQHSVMRLLFQVQEYEPDLVIIYHGINDLYRSLSPDAFAEGDYRSDYGHYHGAISNLVDPARARRSVFRMYTGYWFSDLRFDVIAVRGPDGRGINGMRTMFLPKSRPVDVVEWPSAAAFERNMRDFVRIAQARGIDVVLASQPYLYRTDLTDEERAAIWFPAAQQERGTRPSIASMIAGMEQLNDVTRRIAAETSSGFVDLETAVPKTLEHFYDDVHYTPAGNERVAEAFHEHIVAAGLVGSRSD